MPPRTYAIQRDGVDLRIEGFNIIQAADHIEALPGARMALWLECLSGNDRETQRRIHVYDGDLNQWHEIQLGDYVIE